uniref:Uncharacterized protein n=1 Tax=Ditylenchus dipsaci TaxID=166011 RepID=A0A915E7S1_9BILA
MAFFSISSIFLSIAAVYTAASSNNNQSTLISLLNLEQFAKSTPKALWPVPCDPAEKQCVQPILEALVSQSQSSQVCMVLSDAINKLGYCPQGYFTKHYERLIYDSYITFCYMPPPYSAIPSKVHKTEKLPTNEKLPPYPVPVPPVEVNCVESLSQAMWSCVEGGYDPCGCVMDANSKLFANCPQGVYAKFRERENLSSGSCSSVLEGDVHSRVSNSSSDDQISSIKLVPGCAPVFGIGGIIDEVQWPAFKAILQPSKQQPSFAKFSSQSQSKSSLPSAEQLQSLPADASARQKHQSSQRMNVPAVVPNPTSASSANSS